MREKVQHIKLEREEQTTPPWKSRETIADNFYMETREQIEDNYYIWKTRERIADNPTSKTTENSRQHLRGKLERIADESCEEN